jgi:putative transposase
MAMRRPLDATLVERIRTLIRRHPTFGYRKLSGPAQVHGWPADQRQGRLSHPQSEALVCPPAADHSAATRAGPAEHRSGLRSALGDGPHPHLLWSRRLTVIWRRSSTATIAQIVGWEFSLRGRAREAERALEEACLARFGTLRPEGRTPTIRSDNGLIFTARRFRAACRDYHLRQEFITPYTPEQNGMIERFFRSLKEECVWQHNFAGFVEARVAIGEWIRWYNERRPHQALGYLSPHQYRTQQLQAVA